MPGKRYLRSDPATLELATAGSVDMANDLVAVEASGAGMKKIAPELFIAALNASNLSSGTVPDARISESSVTNHEGAIDHNALTNYTTNRHIDWTSAASNLVTSKNVTGAVLTGTSSVKTDTITENGNNAGVTVEGVAFRDNVIVAAADTPVISDSIYFSDNGAAIDSVTLQALMRVWGGTSFPGTPSDGDVFFRTDHREWYSYDSTNSVWLGQLRGPWRFAYNGTGLNNTYLRHGHASGTAGNGDVVPVDSAVVRITACWNTTATTGNIRVRRDGSNIAALDVSTGSNTVADSGDIYAAFDGRTAATNDGRMAVYLDTLSASISHPIVDVFMRRRAT